MNLNGKEYGFAYTVWAHCEYNDWIVKNPNSSYARAVVQKAVIMSKAYCDIHGGGNILDAKDVMNLPKSVFDVLLAETDEAEKPSKQYRPQKTQKAPKSKRDELGLVPVLWLPAWHE